MVPRTDHRALVPEWDFQIYPYMSETLDKSQIGCSFCFCHVCVSWVFFLMLSSGAFKKVTGLKPTDAMPHFFTSEFWVVSNYKRLSPTVWRSEEAHRWKEGRCVGTSIEQMCRSPMPVTARPGLWGRTLCTWHYMRLTQLTWWIPAQSSWKEGGRSADRKFSKPLQPHREQTVDATCYDRFMTFSGQLVHLCLSG